MNTDKINVPKDLMKNVEDKLRKHVENKKKKLHIYAVAAAISMALILPISAYAYNKYYMDFPFKQEIDLARQNNNIAKVNKTFKYKNVEFNIKGIVADETGMEIIYDVSNPKYFIDGVVFCDANNKFLKSCSYISPFSDLNLDKKEKALYIDLRKDEVDYMRNNPVTLNFDKVLFKTGKDNELWKKFNSFIGIKDDSFKVEWSLKMNVPISSMKTIPINKEYNLNIGKLKLNSLNEGVLKSIIKYDIIPSDKNIYKIQPLFSIRTNKDYANNVSIRKDDQYIASSLNSGEEEFKSIYYKKINEISIRLVGAVANYSFNNTKEYEVLKDKLPMDFEFKGEKFKVVSMLENEDSIEYVFEFANKDKIYNNINIKAGDNYRTSGEIKKVEFKDQVERNKIYDSLIKKVPDLNSIYSNAGQFEGGIFVSKVKETLYVKDKINKKFRVDGATKSFLYDTDEIIIKP